jgi:protein-disulfide isomerase
MMKKHFWKLVALVVVVLLGASFIYAKQAGEKANEGVTVETRVKGNPDAKVTLVEYSDFQCPACGQFYPYVKDVMDEYGDQIRFEYRHFPLINIHPQALPAARAAEAAGVQGKFWEMHDKLFENQSTWSRSSNPTGFFNQYAEELGLNVDDFKRHLGSSVIEDAVMAGFNDARGRGFTGTPTFLLNDQLMTFTTFDEFRAQIEAAVAAPAS